MNKIQLFEQIGYFTITIDSFVILDIYPSSVRTTSNQLDFLKTQDLSEMSAAIIRNSLKKKKIKVDQKIKKLISSGFFHENLAEALRIGIRHKIIIVKGGSMESRSPKSIMNAGLPPNFGLVDSRSSFYLAYLLSRFATSDFLSVHNIDRLYIMSDPLEKIDKYDDNLIVEWDPALKSIGTALYDNNYSGDKSVGYVFFF